MLPLEGVRVIDCSHIWAGPFTATLLANLGAEVIRVESIQRMSGMRGSLTPLAAPPPNVARSSLGWGYAENTTGERPYDRYAGYNGTNYNKLSITLDLLRPAGQELFQRLAALSDIVTENYAAGVLSRMGLGYDTLSKINPGIIVISMPLLGNTGPYRHWRGGGPNSDTMSGHVSLRGYNEGETAGRQGTLHTDAVVPPNAAFAAVAALYRRRRTGRGQLVDVSHAEAFMPHLGEFFLDYSMNGRVAKPLGNRHPDWAPHGVYRAQGDDRWVAIAVRSEEEWAALGQALGDPEWSHDPRFTSAEGRKAHEDELDRLLEGWTREQEPAAIAAALQTAGVPAAPVHTHADTYADPHLAARGFFQTLSHPAYGAHRHPGMGWRSSGAANETPMPAALLGEHNRQVLAGLLGLSDDDYARLESDRIIGNAYLPTAMASR
ncbi:MAG: CoA transferase [Chloroflexi bacterium]|nr:CoA transferase [Chloroflexota bacterium]